MPQRRKVKLALVTSSECSNPAATRRLYTSAQWARWWGSRPKYCEAGCGCLSVGSSAGMAMGLLQAAHKRSIRISNSLTLSSRFSFFPFCFVFLVSFYCCWLNKRDQNPRASPAHRPTYKKKANSISAVRLSLIYVDFAVGQGPVPPSPLRDEDV